MAPRSTRWLLAALCLVACAEPAAPASSPAPPAPAFAGQEPETPPGIEGLRAAPSSARIDLSASRPELRAFSPSSRSASGRTTLSFTLHESVSRWAWSSSRPGALSFEEGNEPGIVTLLAGSAGATLARIATAEDPTRSGEEASVLISVPQLARVRADGDFKEVLRDRLGLEGAAPAVIEEAKRAVDAIYKDVNVRVIWSFGLGESPPAHFEEGGSASGKLIEVTLHGDLRKCVTARSSLLYTEFGGYAEGDSTKRLMAAPVHVCPAIFERHPDEMAYVVKSRSTLFASDPSRAPYRLIVGRALGELIAHEIGHQLLGCDTRPVMGLKRCHDTLPGSLMNKAGERSFRARTGIAIKPWAYGWKRPDFPAPGTFEDHGVEAINTLPPYGQAALDRILPVPPAMAEEPPCAGRR